MFISIWISLQQRAINEFSSSDFQSQMIKMSILLVFIDVASALMICIESVQWWLRAFEMHGEYINNAVCVMARVRKDR